MPSVTVALDDDGLLHLRLPADGARVRPLGSAMVGTTTGALAGVAWGDGYTDFDVRLDARLDDPEAPAPAPHTWTDAQVEAAVSERFASCRMRFDDFSPGMQTDIRRRMRSVLDAALAAGPMPVRAEAGVARPESDDDGTTPWAVQDADPRRQRRLLRHAHLGVFDDGQRCSWSVEDPAQEESAYGHGPTMALAKKRAEGAARALMGTPAPATVALVRAARMALDILRADTATRRAINAALSPFAGVDGEGSA